MFLRPKLLLNSLQKQQVYIRVKISGLFEFFYQSLRFNKKREEGRGLKIWGLGFTVQGLGLRGERRGERVQG